LILRHLFISLLILLIAACGGSESDHSSGQTQAIEFNRLNPSNMGERWFEDNNLAVSGEATLDFISRLSEPSSWQDSRNIMDVFYLRVGTYKKYLKGNSSLMNEMATLFSNHNIALALDETAPIWAHSDLYSKDLEFNESVNNINDLIAHGFDLKYIGLQSVLSKPLRNKAGSILPYSMALRYLDVSTYISKVKAQFPNMSIGVIDALPAHVSSTAYQGAYSGLISHLTAKNLTIDFIHLDLPMNLPRENKNNLNYSSLVSIKNYITTSLELKFGLFVTDRVGGYQSSEEYENKVLDGLTKFIQAGGVADSYILSAWFPYPQYSAPDSVEAPNATQLSTFNKMDQTLNFFGDFNSKHCIYDVRQTGNGTKKDILYPSYVSNGQIGKVLFRVDCFDSVDSAPLYNCKDASNMQFVSNDIDCEGHKALSPSLIGYIRDIKSADTSELYRCKVDDVLTTTTNISNCSEESSIASLGFVDN